MSVVCAKRVFYSLCPQTSNDDTDQDDTCINKTIRLFKMQPVRAAPAARSRVLNSPTNLLFPHQNHPSSQLRFKHEFGKNLRIQRLRNCAAKHSHHALLVVSRDEGLKEQPAAPKPPPPSTLKLESEHAVSEDNASEGKYKGGPSTLTLPLGDREVNFSTLIVAQTQSCLKHQDNLVSQHVD